MRIAVRPHEVLQSLNQLLYQLRQLHKPMYLVMEVVTVLQQFWQQVEQEAIRILGLLQEAHLPPLRAYLQERIL